MQERDPTYKAGVGDRIAYVLIENGARMLSEMGEDPLYAMQNGLPIAHKEYHRQLIKPIGKMLLWIFSSKEKIRVLNDYQEAMRKELFAGNTERCDHIFKKQFTPYKRNCELALATDFLKPQIGGTRIMPKESNNRSLLTSHFKILGQRKSLTAGEIEDLDAKIMERQEICNRCRGFKTEMGPNAIITCQQKDCANLYQMLWYHNKRYSH